MDLIHLWICLVGLVVLLYVVLDGFGLGVALLFPTARDEAERDVLMNSIAPVWDANQTWLVFGGGALFASFPVMYAVLFSALYIPLLTLIFGLIFRGVAFEFRANSTHKTAWNRAFFGGSLAAVLAQGMTLGGFLSGTRVVNLQFAGGPFDWLNPFSIMVGLALVSGYGLLGATYLLIKTDGPVQKRAFAQARTAALTVAGFLVLVSIWTPYHDPAFLARWLSPPRLYFIWTFPLLGVVAFFFLLKSLKARKENQPFFWSVLLFVSSYLGLLAALYPYAIPPAVTLYDAVSQHETLVFTLWGVCLVLPVVLAYNGYSYWVFRGKVQPGEGYH
jgi:cytochrome bd ubiquinol oxidase subunit II